MHVARGLVLSLALGFAFGACRSDRAPGPEPVHHPRLIDGLGAVHHPISSQSEPAQRYFDQGLALAYGFNHEGAIDAFHEAARQDPQCAICWWGIAFSYGPNINAPMGPEAAEQAWQAAQEAKRLAKHASPAERDYIAAIEVRYAAPSASAAGAPAPPDRKALDQAFAVAMREVSRKHPDDLDAATLYAESLMDLSPWDYWRDDASPREHTRAVEAALQSVLARDPDHIGALHYVIHLYERFEPERAEPAADQLGALAPRAGHLVHMPAHIYYRLGRYEDSAAVNEDAAAADVAYFSWCRAPAAYAALYYPHNVHFLWASAMAEGRSDAALTASRRLVAQVPEDQLATFPFLEDFLATPFLTLARFGRWDQILAEPRPPASQRFVTAFWRYGRAFAQVRRGDLVAANAELSAFEAIAADPELSVLAYDTSGGTAGERLEIARHHLAGEIAALSGDPEMAVAELEEAVRIQDAMKYSEPPPFYFPVRQALGAVLLAHGRASEAEAVYREDLRRYPKQGWSLYGLSQSLAAQGRTGEAQWAETGFRNAWARADVQLSASRF
jgi:tetratricopeptide (TPR) repeat protein